MAEKIKHPSLPSNCVSILQLRGVSINELRGVSINELRGVSLNELRGVSINELRGVSLNELRGVSLCELQGVSIRELHRRREEPILKEKEEVRKSNEDGEKCKGSNSKFVPRRPYHPRNAKSSKAEIIAEEEAVTETVVVVGEEGRGGDRRSDGSKEKQKRKKNRKSRKLKKEVEVTGDMVVPALKVMENEIVPINRESEKKTMRSEWRCKGKNVVVKGEVSEPKSDPAVEIGQEVDDRVVNRGKLGGKEKARMRFDRNGDGGGGGGRYKDPGMFREKGFRKPRDES